MAPLADDELVAAAKGGDRNALDQLLRRHYDRIYAVCRRVTGGTKDADDACQEALIKISRSLPRFDGRSAFSTWAYRIATNAALDELRKRNRRPMLHSITNDHGDVPEAVDPMAAKQVDAIADRLAIDEALSELGDDFKAAVVLRDVADLDYAEIAEILDVPIGTVKSRIARGRATLADRLRLDALLDDPRTDPVATATADPHVDPLTADEHSDSTTTMDVFEVSGNRDVPDERPIDPRPQT